MTTTRKIILSSVLTLLAVGVETGFAQTIPSRSAVQQQAAAQRQVTPSAPLSVNGVMQQVQQQQAKFQANSGIKITTSSPANVLVTKQGVTVVTQSQAASAIKSPTTTTVIFSSSSIPAKVQPQATPTIKQPIFSSSSPFVTQQNGVLKVSPQAQALATTTTYTVSQPVIQVKAPTQTNLQASVSTAKTSSSSTFNTTNQPKSQSTWVNTSTVSTSAAKTSTWSTSNATTQSVPSKPAWMIEADRQMERQTAAFMALSPADQNKVLNNMGANMQAHQQLWGSKDYSVNFATN